MAAHGEVFKADRKEKDIKMENDDSIPTNSKNLNTNDDTVITLERQGTGQS